MKKILNIITATMLSMFLYFSCIDDIRFGDNALEKPAGVDITIDTIFGSAELARRELWSLYHYIPTPIPHNSGGSGIIMNLNSNEALSDCVHSVMDFDFVTTTWYTGTYNALSDNASRWKFQNSMCYQGMRLGQIFLANIDRVPDMSDTEKARLKAEAKVIIAGKHWELFRYFGGIPLGDHVFTVSETDGQFPRATLEETLNYMLTLLDEAIAEPTLPWDLEEHEKSEWWGRITKAAAVSQKIQVLLTAASPLFNDNAPYIDLPNHPAIVDKLVWYGRYRPELWTDLKNACEYFISQNAANGNPFRLLQASGTTVDDYMQAFLDAYWNRNTSELVYVNLGYTTQGRPSWWDNIYSGPTSGWGSQCPTAEFMEMFPNADGSPFDTTGIYVYEVQQENITAQTYNVPDKVKNRPPRADNYYIYDNRDPRLYETIWVQKRDMRWIGGPSYEQWPGGVGYDCGDATLNITPSYAHGLLIKKWVLNHRREEHRQRIWSYPVMRMGGFHLIYAEALAETGDLQGACDQINLVRARVGMGKIETFIPEVLTDKERLIKEILRERVCELGYEDARMPDMMRRKLVDDFKKPLHGVFTYRTDGVIGPQGSDPYPELWYSRRQIRAFERAWWEYPGHPSNWVHPTLGVENHWLLNAFPKSEVLKGYGLIQNPGWD